MSITNLSADPREYQDSPRITRDSYFVNFDIVSDIKQEIQVRLDDALRQIVSDMLDELTDEETGRFDRYVATKLIRRAGFGKVLPLILQD